MELFLVLFFFILVVWIVRNYSKPKPTKPKPTYKGPRISEANQAFLIQNSTDQFRIHKHKYLKSSQWQALRTKVIARDKHCQDCGATTDLQVHHLRYSNLGNEPLSDLVLLCGYCHNNRHQSLGIPQTLEEYLQFNDTKDNT